MQRIQRAPRLAKWLSTTDPARAKWWPKPVWNEATADARHLLAGAGTMTYGAELDAGDVVNVTEAKGIEGTDPEA